MATSSCTLTYINTFDKAYPESSATYHFGYGNAGQRWVACYKVTVPSYTGTFNKISFSISVNRGTAYPTNKTSTWKIGLDSLGPVLDSASGNYTAGSVYANGYYGNAGTYTNTFSGTITTSTSSFTSTFSSQSNYFSSGSVFYIYLYSGANEYNSVKLTSLSATLTYTSETITGTNLLVGSSSSNLNTTATIDPSTKKLYWRISGLQYQVKNYTGFHLYLKTGLSFTNGQTSEPTGTKLSTYSSTTSTATSFTQSFTVPTSTLKINDPTSSLFVVAIAQNASGYWRIGGSGNSPIDRQVFLIPSDWFADKITTNVSYIDKTTARINVKHLVSNSPKYLNYVELSTSSMSSYGTSTYLGTASGNCSFATTTSSPTTKTISLTGLNPGTTYKYYPVAYGNTTYAYHKYYGLNQTIEFTTDANYSGTTSASVTGSTTATISCTVNSTINLDGNIYYSTTSGLSSKPSTYVSYDSNRKGTKLLTGLTANKSYTYYFYVYSSASSTLYSIGSVTFTTDASSYTGTITSSNITSDSALLTLNNLSSTTNLNSKWYISTTNSSTTTSLSNIYSAERGSIINLINLLESTNYTFYGYVFSSASSKYYKIGEVNFSTNPSAYTANVVITGITNNSAYLCMYNLSNTNNLDGNYYICSNNYGTSSSAIDFIASIQWSNSYQFTNLIPGNEYVYYIYVYNSSTNTYMYVTTANFVTHSGIIYIKNEELEPYRLYIYNSEDGNWYGLSLYGKETPEIFYLKDSSMLMTSDGLIFNTAGDNIYI